jgi:SAM-dependent methyltransferase
VTGNRWLESDVPRGQHYDQRFDDLAAAGHDMHGEATLVDAYGPGRVLDAGCGTGRVAIELDRRGHSVVGVDLDPEMLAVARAKAPHLTWTEGDLADPDLDLGPAFDTVVLAGNVLIFVTPGTEGAVIGGLARHLRPGGRLIAGYSLQPGRLQVEAHDRLAARAGLELEDRWSTWDRQPFSGFSTYAVSVHRLEG